MWRSFPAQCFDITFCHSPLLPHSEMGLGLRDACKPTWKTTELDFRSKLRWKCSQIYVQNASQLLLNEHSKLNFHRCGKQFFSQEYHRIDWPISGCNKHIKVLLDNLMIDRESGETSERKISTLSRRPLISLKCGARKCVTKKSKIENKILFFEIDESV